MKRLLLIIMTVTLLVISAACNKMPNVEHSIGFYSLFGETFETVTKNIDFGNAEGAVKGNQTTYTFDCNDNNEGFVKKQLVFYNDVLMAEETYFTDIKQAYNFAKKYRKDFEDNYGQKNTYPGLNITNTDYFDNITGVEYLKDGYRYYEDYTVEVSHSKTDEPWLNNEKAQKMLSDETYSRIDLRLELKVINSGSACVGVRYVVIP